MAGAGGFIGGHLASALVATGAPVRAVDSKPLERWYQQPEGAELVVADIRDPKETSDVTAGAREV